MCEELDVCEDGIVAGGQGRFAEEIVPTTIFLGVAFGALVVVPVALFLWHFISPTLASLLK